MVPIVAPSTPGKGSKWGRACGPAAGFLAGVLPLALFFLAAPSTSVLLVDELYQIPANEWRYVEVSLEQQPALVSADYRAEAGAKDVRLALLRRDDLERLRGGRAHGWLAETDAGPTGRLRFRVRDPGEYAIVVDNRSGDGPASVYLKVGLDFGLGRAPEVTTLSPRRQLAVILISFAVFFGIVTWSARRLLRGVGR